MFKKALVIALFASSGVAFAGHPFTANPTAPAARNLTLTPALQAFVAQHPNGLVTGPAASQH